MHEDWPGLWAHGLRLTCVLALAPHCSHRFTTGQLSIKTTTTDLSPKILLKIAQVAHALVTETGTEISSKA